MTSERWTLRSCMVSVEQSSFIRRWSWVPKATTYNYREQRRRYPDRRRLSQMLGAVWIVAGWDWPRRVLRRRQEGGRL